jgi:RimJ/RimL family protein N-acetyltransferase
MVVGLAGPRQYTEPSRSLLSDYCMRQVRRMDDSFEQPFPRPLSGRLVPTPNCLVPSRSPLVGRYVRWEPLNPTIHAAELYQAGHGSDQALRIWEYLPFGPWPDEVAFLAWLRDQAATFDHIWFALRPHKSEQAEGMASYLDIHPLDGVIEIGGIWFGTELQRTRPATEALFLLLSYAMDDLGYRRMQWRCNSLNVKSRNAARRLGFRFEGIFHNHMVSKGRNRDTAWYSILDDEWPEVREIIKAWLSDHNFDAVGNARRSLSELMQKRSPSLHG